MALKQKKVKRQTGVEEDQQLPRSEREKKDPIVTNSSLSLCRDPFDKRVSKFGLGDFNRSL